MDPLGKQPIKVKFYNSYIGNVIIPPRLNRSEFINQCLKNKTIMVHSVDNMIEKDVIVDKDSIKSIVFPENSSEFGSTVLCVTNEITGRSRVVAVFATQDDDQEIFEENQWRIYKSNGDNYVSFDIQGNNGEFHILSNSGGDSIKSTITMLNSSNLAELELLIQGMVNFIINKKIKISSKEGFEFFIKNGKEEAKLKYTPNEGFFVLDEFENSIQTNKDGIELNRGKQNLSINKSGFVFKNNKSDLKKIFQDLFSTIETAIIQTPSGPGVFDAGTITKLNNLKKNINNLFE